MEYTHQTITWKGYQKINRPNKKILIPISIFLLGAAFFVGFVQKDIIGAIFFALAGIAFFLFSFKKQIIADYEVGPMGVKIDDQIYKYTELKSFWINYEPEIGIKELSLQLKKRFNVYVKIPLYDQDPVQIRSALIDLVSEKEHEETMVDLISRKLGV